MKAVTSRKITVPGSYKSDQGTIFEFPGDDRTGPLLEWYDFYLLYLGNNCISCNYRAQTGVLFPLERGFMYLHKVIFIPKSNKANIIFSPQFTFVLMKLTMSTSPGKLPKIEVSNSKLKPRQEPSMFSGLLTETNTTDFSTLPKVMVSRFETSVSLITTTPTNHLHYPTMKMMDLTPTQPQSAKMPWPTLKIQMRVQPMKISIRMTLILKQKLVVTKSSILMPPIDPLILKIVG